MSESPATARLRAKRKFRGAAPLTLMLALGISVPARAWAAAGAAPRAVGFGPIMAGEAAEAHGTADPADSPASDHTASGGGIAAAGATVAPRERAEDAWWTGPMLGASAETLPAGHVLIEPYLFDIRTRASDHFGSLNYLLYGVTDRLSLGLIAVAGYVRPRAAAPDKPAAGDTTLIAQYRLTRFGERGWPVTVSLVAQETLPSGRFDRLEDSRAAGLGGGSHSTTLAVYLQSLAWARNGRILRFRLDSSLTLASGASPTGESVYGTPAGFAGSVSRGAASSIDGSIEYSLSRSWALAAEAVWQRSGPASVTGSAGVAGSRYDYVTRLPGSDAIYFAPAVEYSWRSNLGVLLALRMSPKWRNSAASMTPAVAVNIVL